MMFVVYLVGMLSMAVLYCNCQTTTLTPVYPDVIEGSDITFVCTVSSAVNYVNWQLPSLTSSSLTAAMGLQNETCALSPSTSLLSNESKYSFNCTNTVYQLTVKNVQRSQHNNVWSCYPQGQSSGPTSTINVQIPVSSVSLTPSSVPVDVEENTGKEFTCQTSASRPNASVTWYKVESGETYQINQNITSSTNNDDFSVTTSTLRFVPSRQQHGVQIYCKAENTVSASPIQSGNRTINVLYQADPVILEGNQYSVIENNQGSLTCNVSGGNPTPTLSWNCNVLSPTESDSSNDQVITKTLTWAAERASDISCSCTSQQNGFLDKVVSVNVSVLYPPSPPQFKVNGYVISGNISFIVGKTRSIQCVSDSNPLPSYKWTGPKTNNGQTLTFKNVQKSHNGQYTCEVKNTMNPSIGGNIPGSNSSRVNLVVLYPPSTLYMYNGGLSRTLISKRTIDVVKNDTINIGCKSNDGEPEPTIRWSGQNSSNHLLTVQQVQESLTSKTCTATNTMMETGGYKENGSVSDTINFNVLIPPTIGNCTLYYINEPNSGIMYITDTLKIIENKSFTLKCSAAGDPKPTTSWLIQPSLTVWNKSVTIDNVTRNKKGRYVFYARSILTPSYQDPRDITDDKSFTIDILYAPMVKAMKGISKLEGSTLTYDCPYESGNPTATTFKWTKINSSKPWRSNQAYLLIQNLTKQDSGTYQCEVTNTMIQTGDLHQQGRNSKTFYLNVLYKASITSFTINRQTSYSVTVNERSPVNFTCDVDSNPHANISITKSNGVLSSGTSTILEHNLQATCSDAGMYTCSASNIYNKDVKPEKQIKLFVNCSPRPDGGVDQNKTGEMNQTCSFTFNAIAYPTPNFTWWKLAEDNWIKLESNDGFSIHSSDFLTILTISGLTQLDFTIYKLVAENTIGKFEQNYTLIPNDVPETPREFRQVEDLTTTTSIHVEWKPGFNGGQHQTFHIQYKKSSADIWTYININDTGDTTMNCTLSNLHEKTQYDILIYASNQKGNSSDIFLLSAVTKETIAETSLSRFVIPAGAGSGVCLFLVIAVIVIYRKKRSKGVKTTTARQSPALQNDPNNDDEDSSDDNDDDGLKDNPLYESSAAVVGGAAAGDDIYAKPIKKKKNIVSDDVYAVVDKQKNKGKNAKKEVTATGNKRTQDEVYENVAIVQSDGKTGNQPSSKANMILTVKENVFYIEVLVTWYAFRCFFSFEKRHVNEDGLIYLELDFKTQAKKKEEKDIIGEEPTEYVTVDFTKKACALP